MANTTKLKGKLMQWRINLLIYVLTHFRGFWYILLNTPFLKVYATRLLYNLLASGAAFPFFYSTKYPYATVDAIEDNRYLSRMLPEKPRPDNYQYPPIDELAEDLFLRKGKSDPSQRTDRNSNLFFGGWAQWFAAGFLLTEANNFKRQGLFPTSTANLNTTYGNDDKTRALLRTMSGGKLISQKINGQEYPLYLKDIPELKQLPLFEAFLQRSATHAMLQQSDHQSINTDLLFAFGQIQVNVTPGSIVWGTIFLREHNQICEGLQKRYPQWDDERLYQTARNICTLILNKIIVLDYIGKHNAHHLAMEIPFSPEVLRGPKWAFGIARSIPIEWSQLYRFHSFVPDTMQFEDKEIPLTSAIYNPSFVVQHGLDKVIDQLSKSPICPFGPQNTPHFLLPVEKQTIEDGRRANLATYNDYRERMGLLRALKFEDINSKPSVIAALRKHYKSVDDIEWYVGLIAEEVPPNRLFPMLLNRMLSSVAFSVALLQPWSAPSIWSRREELLTPFGLERLDNTRMETLIYRHVAKETYVSFFLPK